MSVNITVNGKFAKHYRSHPLLSDPHEVKKSQEKERRKLRLLQVREECKKLAKKIRDEVNEEKRRELEKLQATKERELECWRQHALQRKGEEYREAIFQIGTAHQAAKMENEQKVQSSFKDFKKQMAARKCQPGKVQFICRSLCPCKQTFASAKKTLKCTCTQADEHSPVTKDEPYKRKRNYSFSSSESECDEEDCKDRTNCPSSYSLNSSCDSTSSTLNENTQTSTFVPTENKSLIKTPAVFLDVEVGTDDSISISGPAEVKDRHCEYNRQFNSVISVSPTKESKKKENTSEISSAQQSLTTITLSSNVTAKKQNSTKSSIEKYPNKNIHDAPESNEKRFTIISDLVKKQQQNEPKTDEIDHTPSCTPKSQAKSSNTTPHISPRKHPSEKSVRHPVIRPPTESPRKTNDTSKSSRAAFTSHTATTKRNTATMSGSSGSGRVQFYDYNSKLKKEQDQAATSVKVQRQNNQNQLSAMEQAEIENQREKDRQLEVLKKYQQMDERGQKALEREQIRRDCHELTEKLEVLTKEFANQLPTKDNQLHIFADKHLRKEGKKNLTIEKLLQRPSVITCSEKKQPIEIKVKPKSPNHLTNILNVAYLNNKPLAEKEDISSDSCRSILLGYVDDQSRLIKEDLHENNTTHNQSKQKRLQNLLDRLDQIRKSLVEELRNENDTKVKKLENLKQAIDSISEMRKQHAEAEILVNHKDQDKKLLSEREKELRAKENILEIKLREFYELQKQHNKSQNSEVRKDLKQSSKKEENEKDNTSSSNNEKQVPKINPTDKKLICNLGENPLEIIITVKGEGNSVKIPKRTKRKNFLKRSPNKLSTIVKSPQLSLAMAKKQTPKKKKSQVAKPFGGKIMLRSQDSYDSNSTSYLSLPPDLTTKIDDLPQLITMEMLEQKKLSAESEMVNQITSNQQESEPISNTARLNPRPYVNPLIAQYVHRLLGMSHSAVNKLNMSSSDIETPCSSIINTSGNVTNSDTIISDEHLTNLHLFIEENKSFIKDIEQSFKIQKNASFENSMKIVDHMWRKRLKKKNIGSIESKKTEEIKQKVQTDNMKQNSSKTKEKKACKNNNDQQTTNKNPIECNEISADNLLKDLNKTLSSQYSTDGKNSSKHTVETFGKAIDVQLSNNSSKSDPNSQFARYAKLTENCTNRIAELTELIDRVREEKQRLLEVTLSSVSDNDRQSTDYLELPEGKRNMRNEQNLNRVSSSSEENTHSRCSDALHIEPKLSAADKNKQIANSRDSGIAESRPITALENRIDQEPLSQTSSESTMPQSVRKMKPPPTLKRFSPQLPADDLAHELSTIFEVDTPATSRINTAVGQSAEERENAFKNTLQEPVKFPTFEQYIKQLDLDITQLDPDQNIQLQQEFATFLECLQQCMSPKDVPKYFECPSINAYIQDLAESDLHLGETMEESLAKLHISGIYPQSFLALREYIQRNASKSVLYDEQLLDTESLENITDKQSRSNTDNDTASLDIEEELKKRNILKKSFRVQKQQVFSSTAHKDAVFYQEILAAESGVDKLSTSGNTSDILGNDSKPMLQQWPKEFEKTKKVKTFSSTTSSVNASDLANSALRATSLGESSKEFGRAFNLRDFLTRELEKLANNSGSISNSSSDESLRNHFLHSLIGSLTPRTGGATSKSNAQTLDRQKTSTPVPIQSSQTHSTVSNHSNLNSSNQLFSGESRLSSVRYQDQSTE